jgi:hypothetical protein
LFGKGHGTFGKIIYYMRFLVFVCLFDCVWKRERESDEVFVNKESCYEENEAKAFELV